jgi:hypothetical protein
MLAEKEIRMEVELREFFRVRQIPSHLLLAVKDMSRRSRGAKRRLAECDVQLLQDAPQICRMLVHMEMFQPVLRTFRWLPVDMPEGLCLNICHKAVSETLVKPSHCLFLPGETCEGPLTMTSGYAEYFTDVQNVMTEQGEELPEGAWAAEISLWVEWKYLGSMVAQETGIFVTLRAQVVADLLRRFGGPFFKKMQMYGLLLASHVEEEQAPSDMPSSRGFFEQLRFRAHSMQSGMLDGGNLRASFSVGVSKSRSVRRSFSNLSSDSWVPGDKSSE